MNTEQTIAVKLQTLAPTHCELINESHQHAGPAQDSHFKVILVSEVFAGLRLVARHQKLYQLLAAELQGPVHALTLHLYTPEEWRKANVPDSPNCMGHGH